jgi:hypothetical protein
MRRGIHFFQLVVGVSAVVTCSSAVADIGDIGAVVFLLSSPHDNSTLDSNPATGVIEYTTLPGTVPVTVKFTATTSGPLGSNNGAMALYANLTGSALAAQTSQMTIDPTFKRDMYTSVHTSYSSYSMLGPVGLGFDAAANLGALVGPGGENGIFGFGASQVSNIGSVDFQYLDARYVGHPAGSHDVFGSPITPVFKPGGLDPDEQYYRAVGPVTAFTGTLDLAGVGTITLNGGVDLWVPGGDNTGEAATTASSLVITLIPEPASALVLIAPILLRLGRRRSRR